MMLCTKPKKIKFLYLIIDVLYLAKWIKVSKKLNCNIMINKLSWICNFFQLLNLVISNHIFQPNPFYFPKIIVESFTIIVWIDENLDSIAKSSAVFPRLSFIFLSMPLISNFLTILECPYYVATCKAVWPLSLVWAFNLAPQGIKKFTIY